MLYNLGLRMLGNPDDARDASQTESGRPEPQRLGPTADAVRRRAQWGSR